MWTAPYEATIKRGSPLLPLTLDKNSKFANLSNLRWIFPPFPNQTSSTFSQCSVFVLLPSVGKFLMLTQNWQISSQLPTYFRYCSLRKKQNMSNVFSIWNKFLSTLQRVRVLSFFSFVWCSCLCSILCPPIDDHTITWIRLCLVNLIIWYA